jgi:hypothetical protein
LPQHTCRPSKKVYSASADGLKQRALAEASALGSEAAQTHHEEKNAALNSGEYEPQKGIPTAIEVYPALLKQKKRRLNAFQMFVRCSQRE